MKTTLTILTVAFLVFLIYFRQRIYLRDLIATVYRNNVQQSGIEVYFNYSDEVLLIQDTGPTPRRILIQDWNKMPGTPMALTCLHWIACMTETDNAPSIPLGSPAKPAPSTGSARRAAQSSPASGKGAYDPKVFINGHQVLFTDTDGSAVRVELR